jgi:hypothetical protein
MATSAGRFVGPLVIGAATKIATASGQSNYCPVPANGTAAWVTDASGDYGCAVSQGACAVTADQYFLQGGRRGSLSRGKRGGDLSAQRCFTPLPSAPFPRRLRPLQLKHHLPGVCRPPVLPLPGVPLRPVALLELRRLRGGDRGAPNPIHGVISVERRRACSMNCILGPHRGAGCRGHGLAACVAAASAPFVLPSYFVRPATTAPYIYPPGLMVAVLCRFAPLAFNQELQNTHRMRHSVFAP